MLLATWNVNSIRARLPRLLAWLERRRPDVVCLQETKVVDADFPAAEIQALGYHCRAFGQKTYNGVAILSREAPADVQLGFPDDPPDADRRLLAATVGGVRVINVYVPNGTALDDPRYEGKLAWFRRLRLLLEQTASPHQELAVCGDFNVAPEDRDVWDPELWRGQLLFTEAEKEALRQLFDWGLEDTLRRLHPEASMFTWWDYRNAGFYRGWGLRIDHVLATRPLAARCTEVEVDRAERKGDKPSDHAPVLARFGDVRGVETP
ncbi:MAG TPA: exodeoxyribonuclease III [Thermoanaerobaculaceae bacterium]|nr:exodeoxyribonuclease III [Thermoanaerobaculaceae bacterium]HRS14983.1 exodeoxyribonuclease III [Thermoanaerobaculaceae bacterium]